MHILLSSGAIIATHRIKTVLKFTPPYEEEPYGIVIHYFGEDESVKTSFSSEEQRDFVFDALAEILQAKEIV